MFYKVKINSNNVETFTARAVLVKCPKNSEFKNYFFWFPLSMVKEVGKKHELNFGDKWEFRMFKKNGDEMKCGAIDVLEMFNVEYEDLYETHKPEKINAEEESILDELKDE